MKRKVRIEYKEEHNTYFVFFVERRKFGRYTAAQFNGDVMTEAEVKQWVREQPHLELVEP